MANNREWFVYLAAYIVCLSVYSGINAMESTLPEKSTWQLGIGVGGISLPHYRGSDQRAEYISPVPYLHYEGERLKLDREGGRYYFYDSDETKLDVSTAFALPVDSDDNRARKGMPNLDANIELGPRIQFTLYQSYNKNTRLRLAIPLRAVFATDLRTTKNIGWVFSPYLQLRYFTDGWESATSFGPVWASEQYHDYFYEIAPQYATTERPVYNAQAGYSGSRITFTLNKRFHKYFFGLFARYDNLSGAVFNQSPLVKRNDSFMLGAAFSWVFAEPVKNN